MRTDWNGASHAMWWFSNVSIKLHGGIAHLHSRHNMVYVGAGTPGPAHALWAGHCCIWLCMVHRCEHMCTFKVLDEHSGMCTVISSTAHVHIWRDMLHVDTNMPEVSVSGHLLWADYCSKQCLSYAAKFEVVQRPWARWRVNMSSTDIDVQQVLFILHTAHLGSWRCMLHGGTNMSWFVTSVLSWLLLHMTMPGTHMWAYIYFWSARRALRYV